MSKKQVSYDGVNWMDVDNAVDSTKYRHTRTVDDEASVTTVPCETCGAPTEMLGTKRCDACHEVEKRLPDYLRSANGRALVRRLLQEQTNVEADDEKRTHELCETGVQICSESGCKQFATRKAEVKS